MADEKPVAVRTEAQLIKASDSLPAKIKISKILPDEGRKGLKFRSFKVENVYSRFYLKQLYYKIWAQHPWVRAYIDKIAKVASTVGWFVKYTGMGKADAAIIKTISDFFKSPNELESFEDILQKTVKGLKIWAEFFWEIVKDSDGFATDFYTLDGVIDVKLSPHGEYENPAFIQIMNSEKIEFSFDEVIRFILPDPLGETYPSSELEALEFVILLDIKTMALNKRSFDQSVRGGKVFLFPEGLGEEEMKRNRAEINSIYSGIVGSFQAFVALEGECKIEDLKLVEFKMEGKDLREFNRGEISAVLGVPPTKVGIMEAEVKESQLINKNFYDEEVKPILVNISNSINRYLKLQGIYDYEFEFKGYPSRDMRETARMVDVLSKRGIYTVNEIREMVGQNPIPGGDILYFEGRDGFVYIIDDTFGEQIKLRNKIKEADKIPANFTFKPSGSDVKAPRKDKDDEIDQEDGESYFNEEDEEGENVNPF